MSLREPEHDASCRLQLGRKACTCHVGEVKETEDLRRELARTRRKLSELRSLARIVASTLRTDWGPRAKVVMGELADSLAYAAARSEVRRKKGAKR